MPKLRILLLQLPVQSHDYEYSKENIPLALGYLQGFAQKHLRRSEIRILSPEVANYGGDAALLHAIEQERPHVVGFSCALWNVERTLYLCRRLKAVLPETVIVLGGPEVSPDNTFLFASDEFDFAIVGEGEQPFRDLLLLLEEDGTDLSRIPGLAYRRERRWVFNGAASLLESLDILPSPYLTGLVNPSFSNTIAIETVRGCPYRCAYCYYHKSYPKLRTFDLGRIEAELRWAVERGVEEVTFLDPCFARRPDLMTLLKTIQALNRERLFRVQCELNAEDLSAKRVHELARAGVVEVEVGLQTINPEALRRIQRRFHKDTFIEGVRMLRSAGIRVLVDLMVGLPGDSLGNVKQSIDFVMENDLCDELKLYPLSVLPGTDLRRRSRELGLHYQERPPYTVLRTAQMGPEDMFEAFLYAEQATGGGDFFPPEMPAACDDDTKRSAEGRFIHEIILERKDSEKSGSTATVSPQEIGQSLCIRVKDPDWQEKLDAVRLLLSPLLRSNPFTLIDWLIPEESYPTEETLKAITDLSLWPEHPSNREDFATHTPIRSARIFILSRSDKVKDPVLSKIPLFDEETLIEKFSRSPVQRVCWVAFPPEMEPEEEERFIERLMERFKQKKPGLRLADLPDEGLWKSCDSRIRTLSVPI